MAGLHAGTVVDAEASASMITVLRYQQHQALFPRAWLAVAAPFHRPAQDAPALAHKTGYVGGTRTDAGLVLLPGGGGTVAYAAAADGLADRTMTALAEGDEILGRLGAIVLARWWPGPGPVPVRVGWLPEDGSLLFTGGPDILTEPLGLGPVHPAARPGLAAKQDFDLTLTRRALDLDIPVLGICYGMQLLGILAGARLLQHLPDDRPGATVRHSADPGAGGPGGGGPVRHDLALEPGTLAGKALGGAGRLSCVSAHHQAITDPGPGWRVSARDDDGLVEAIESRTHRFAVGVQWHPERDDEEPAHLGLFRALVEAARQP
jgi:gamma-glutamyl-gamma-aminobutyrate hydrolase PuuD